jgi:3-isopropylmalate/(R)-2-methylmalate dehydratase small subunit
MQPVKVVRGRAVPLDRSDVDTDQIIPSDWLKRVERTGFGEGLFAEWREDPDFVLNKPEHVGAVILVAGPNFGIGSSREHAVWAIQDYGFQAVVSPRFGDIFRTNATKAGLVPAQIEAAGVRRLLDELAGRPDLEVVVDVDRLVVAVPELGAEWPFELDAHTRWRLLEGLDDIGLTERHGDAIAEFEASRPSWMPVTTAGR